jgi:hypothetical protein
LRSPPPVRLRVKLHQRQSLRKNNLYRNSLWKDVTGFDRCCDEIRYALGRMEKFFISKQYKIVNLKLPGPINFYILHLVFCGFAVPSRRTVSNRRTVKYKTEKCKSDLSFNRPTNFYISHSTFCVLRFPRTASALHHTVSNRRTAKYKTAKCKSDPSFNRPINFYILHSAFCCFTVFTFSPKMQN